MYKDLEQLYTENYLSPVTNNGNIPAEQPLTTKQKIIKINGLYGSLLLELEKLHKDFEERQTGDDGFGETVKIILDELETPQAIFDSTFFKYRDRF
jgi:hypothetical protein